MANAKDRLKIFENVIARVGLDGDVLGEYSKAMSSLNGLETYTAMNPPQPPTVPPQATNQPLSGQSDTTMSPLGDNGLNAPAVG